MSLSWLVTCVAEPARSYPSPLHEGRYNVWLWHPLEISNESKTECVLLGKRKQFYSKNVTTSAQPPLDIIETLWGIAKPDLIRTPLSLSPLLWFL